MPEEDAQPPMPPFPGQIVNVRKITFRRLLVILFIHPKLGFALAALNRCWLKAFVFLVAFCLAMSAIKGTADAPKYAKDIRGAAEFLAQTVPGLHIEDGRFLWDAPLDGPKTCYLSSLRFDVAENCQDISGASLKRDILKQGLILDHEGLYYWPASESSAQPGQMPIAPVLNEDVLKPLADKMANGGPLALAPETINQFCATISVFWGAMCAVMMFWQCTTSIFLTVLIFTIVIMITRRRTPFGAFPSALSTSLCICIPPTIAASIYMLFSIGNDFDGLFSIMFIVYIIYNYIEGRRSFVAIPM